ncbi:MAG: hypothetical protein ACI9JL_002413 [Paracoccaceae bacterium]|jgi:hypothetical protein
MSANSLTNLERALSQSKGKGGISSDSPGGPQMCGDIDMRIARDGTWHYMGSPIGRKPLVKLFSSVLKRDEAGDFWLITPAEMCRIKVDDAPFAAVEMTVEGAGAHQNLTFRTNIDEIVTAGPNNPLRVAIDPDTQEPAPYVMIRDGLEALITRAVFYDLVELADVRAHGGASVMGVWSDGKFFEIGSADDE